MNPFSLGYNTADELQVVKEARSGSQKALETLVKQHQAFIYNLALKLVRDENEAADLSQEAIIKMITRLQQFKGNSSFRTWLYRIVINHFIQSKKRKHDSDDENHSDDGEVRNNRFRPLVSV